MKDVSPQRAQFEKTWTAPTGFGDWFASVNNQPYGSRFMTASAVFFFLAGIMALLMRIQLAVPDNDFIGPEVFNQLFTMHGSTMMFLVVLPFIEGLAIYMLPVVIGSREMAFPRMSAFSFWVFFFGGLFFFSGYLFNAVPDAGWFAYPPLSLEKYSGLGLDFLLVGLGFIEIAGMGAGVEIVTTVLKMRAPGMSLGRMPMFAWAWLVTALMIIFAFATLFAATVLIELDRAVGTRFFDPDGGGNVLLWQHLFWFFGHPDVYIMFIPATGMISMILPTFAKRPLAAYALVALAIVVTGFLSFGLWVHHMFATGMPALAMAFFAAASLFIALASGTQVFAWIATLWRTRPLLNTTMLFSLGFLFIFVLGGITGVMVAVLPFDLQAHDTYFVVAHFHYVLIGGVVFPVLAAFHYWFPFITGRMANERIGKWSFWLIFLGFNVAFFPMHFSGLKGMARRVYTYSESLGVGWLNMISTMGSFVLGFGFVLVIINVLYSRKKGAFERKNIWGAGTLEWSVTSEMPNYIYLSPPVIYGRYPLWDLPVKEQRNERLEALSKKLEAAPATWRATLVTDVVTAEPQAMQRVAGPSYIPIIASLAMLLLSIATLIKAYILALVALIAMLFITVIWIWPKDKELEEMRKSSFEKDTGLSIEPTGTKASGWWAMLGTLSILGTVFGVLIYSYFYIRLYSTSWPQGNIEKPEILFPSAAYLTLIASGAFILLARDSFFKQKTGLCLSGLVISAGLGVAFIAMITMEMTSVGFLPQENAYASLFHTLNGHVALLVLGGVGFLVACAVRVGKNSHQLLKGYYVLQMQITLMYWQFTMAVGALIYATLYLSPYVL